MNKCLAIWVFNQFKIKELSIAQLVLKKINKINKISLVNKIKKIIISKSIMMDSKFQYLKMINNKKINKNLKLNNNKTNLKLILINAS